MVHQDLVTDLVDLVGLAVVLEVVEDHLVKVVEHNNLVHLVSLDLTDMEILVVLILTKHVILVQVVAVLVAVVLLVETVVKHLAVMEEIAHILDKILLTLAAAEVAVVIQVPVVEVMEVLVAVVTAVLLLSVPTMDTAKQVLTNAVAAVVEVLVTRGPTGQAVTAVLAS
jgi:hypothetical protein|tara:strand:- start:460 stop:966 length:507 start_codon:yes stop_codon:yes gene_type:complete